MPKIFIRNREVKSHMSKLQTLLKGHLWIANLGWCKAELH